MALAAGWHGGHAWGGGPLFGLLWLVVLAGLVIGAIYLLRRRGRTDQGAEAVLAARYARGDISDEEYRERLAVLRETNR